MAGAEDRFQLGDRDGVGIDVKFLARFELSPFPRGVANVQVDGAGARGSAEDAGHGVQRLLAVDAHVKDQHHAAGLLALGLLGRKDPGDDQARLFARSFDDAADEAK